MTQQNTRPDRTDAEPNTQRSGSDTVSAANNPTSPGGPSPRPQEGFSGSEHGGSDTASAAAMSSGDKDSSDRTDAEPNT